MKFYPFAPACCLAAGLVNYGAWQSYEGYGDLNWKLTYFFEIAAGLTSFTLWFLKDEYPYAAFIDNAVSPVV